MRVGFGVRLVSMCLGVSVLLNQRHLSYAMLDFVDKRVPSRAEPQLHHTGIRR